MVTMTWMTEALNQYKIHDSTVRTSTVIWRVSRRKKKNVEARLCFKNLNKAANIWSKEPLTKETNEEPRTTLGGDQNHVCKSSDPLESTKWEGSWCGTWTPWSYWLDSDLLRIPEHSTNQTTVFRWSLSLVSTNQKTVTGATLLWRNQRLKWDAGSEQNADTFSWQKEAGRIVLCGSLLLFLSLTPASRGLRRRRSWQFEVRKCFSHLAAAEQRNVQMNDWWVAGVIKVKQLDLDSLTDQQRLPKTSTNNTRDRWSALSPQTMVSENMLGHVLYL